MAIEVPRPGIKSELQLQPTPQLWQLWILNPCTRLGIEPPPQQQPEPLQRQCQILNPLYRNGNCHLNSFYFIIFLFYFFFLGPHSWHREVPRWGVKLELQLLAYALATAMPDPSYVCNLHHSSQQCRILNPLSKAKDQTHIFMDTSWVHYCWATMGTPILIPFFVCFVCLFLVMLCNSLMWDLYSQTKDWTPAASCETNLKTPICL